MSLSFPPLTTAVAALPTVHFATAAEGAAELGKTDDFISRLSVFDRSARMKTADEVPTAAFLDFVGAQAQGWTPELEARVNDALKPLAARFETLKLRNLPEVLMIRTTGLEEGHAAYTRGRSIVLPEAMLGKSMEDLTGLLAHELFHVISRSDPELRDELYQIIGFEKCAEVVLPPALAARRLTNPDAPVWCHAITVTVDGRSVKVVPVLVAGVPRYPQGGTEEFFDFLTLRFMALEGEAAAASKADGVPAMFGITQLQGFAEQVGSNTGYVIHPEEILADNFKLLMTGAEGVPSPKILETMKAVLTTPR